MSVLRNLESKLAGLVEGTFGRVFRSEVRPAELARRLAREMDEHRTVSLSRTYAPTEFDIYLSPRDRERFAGIEREVLDELSGYLLEHARAEKLALATTPRIAFHTDERLGLVDRLLRDTAEPQDPDIARSHGTLATARAHTAAEIEAVLTGVVQLRLQVGLLALAGDGGGVADRLKQLRARVTAIEEVEGYAARG